MPFAQAAAQVSEAGAITIGKRQAEQLAIGAAVDFEAFYAARRPQPCPAGTGLLISADGSAFSVRPGALRPATAKAARARQRAAAPAAGPMTQASSAKARNARRAGGRDRHPPAPRTPSDILTALFGTPRPPARMTNPAARHSQGRGQDGARLGPQTDPAVIGEGFAEAHHRDPHHLRPWFAVVNSNDAQIDAISA